jgi:tetratricopeptide (TPR) repeat protein
MDAQWRESADLFYREALADYKRGNFEAAIGNFEFARKIVHELGEIGPEAAAYRDIGVCHAALGRKEQALAAYTQALTLFRRIHDGTGEASVQHNIGLL